MATELQHATFESRSFLAKHLPVEDHIVKSIIDDLGTLHNVHYSKLKYLNGKQMKPWPDTVDSSRDHYEPFTWLLNTILDLSRKNIKQSFHARLNFFLYDRNMHEGADGGSPLKPDLLGCHCKSLDKDEKVSWRDVEIVVEIKDRWPSVVTQAMAYARCCFVFQEARKFITAILFNHSMMEVRIGFYSPSGLVVTEGFLLSSSEGFEKFVRAICGIYARADAASAGIKCTNAPIRIYNGDVYLRGRGTRVYRTEMYRSKITGLLHQLTSEHLRKDRYSLQSWGKIKNATGPETSAANEELQGKNNFGVEGNNKEMPRNDFETASYNEMIYWMKDEDDRRDTVASYTRILQHGPHSNGGKMLEALDGKFGLPRVVYSYDVWDAQNWRTSDVIPADATYWEALAASPRGRLEAIMPEVRIHDCIVLDTKGISLLDAEGPRQLVEGIVHAMIGHYVLFKAGWLHRGVSIGNVLLMKKETREAVEDFEVTKDLKECIAFIDDGDHAIEWRNNERKLASSRSGTPPFMSMRLIQARSIGYKVVHTAVDDLESFIWVLLWAVLVILEAKGELTDPQEKWFLEIMRSDDTKSLNIKAAIPNVLHFQQETGSKTCLAPFRRLLMGFFDIANRGSLATAKFSKKEVWDSKELEGICSGFYEEYITMGVGYLSQLASNWDNYRAVEDDG